METVAKPLAVEESESRMPVTLPELPSETPDACDHRVTNGQVIQLEDRLPEWFRSDPGSTALALLLCVVFVFLNALPLAHTDLWGHLNYGRLIWNSGSIPASEPTMSLAAGQSMVNTAWLSQLIGFGIYETSGTAGLKFLFSTAVTFVLGLVAHVVSRRTSGWVWPAVAVAATLGVGWMQLSIIRPQVAGFLCFGILLHHTLNRCSHRSDWFTIPLLFILWTNLHGSFVVGLLVLAARCGGNFLDTWRASGSLKAAFVTPRVMRNILLLELAALACLANPYGIEIYTTVFSFSKNPNLINLVDWDPLTLRMIQGRAAAVLSIALLVTLRLTPRRIPWTQTLLLIGLGGLAMWTSRMLIWWVPVAACTLGIHGAPTWRRSRLHRRLSGHSREQLRHLRLQGQPVLKRSLWTVSTLGLVFIAFSLTPLSVQMKTGHQQRLTEAVSSSTPVAVCEFLNEMTDHPGGPVLSSYDWGDYLQWTCPQLDLFVNSHAHLVPKEVWNHYIDITNANHADDLLDRYGVNMVVLKTDDSPYLLEHLRERVDRWTEIYSDERGLIFVRTQPI